MSEDKPDRFNLIRPWAREEFDVLSSKEYEILKRYHEETCNEKIHCKIS